jgi:TP901-1 family phage major tail protein
MAELPATDFGGKVVIAARLLDDASKSAGQKFAFETTHEYHKTRDSNDTATKDGVIYSYGDVATELTVEMISSDFALKDMMESAIDNNSIVEFWRIFTNRPGKTSGSYVMEYMRGRLNDFDENADADDFVTLSLDVNIDGKPQKGEGAFTITDNGAGYEFRDLSVVTAPAG